MSVNKVILVGNVGKDPETRYLDENTAICKFPLATSETYKNRSGERVSTTEWHNIVLWRGLAQVAEKYVKKGTQIYIEGRIKSRSYDDAEGNKKYITEIVGDQMQLLGRRPDGEESSQRGDYQQGSQAAQRPVQPAQPQAQEPTESSPQTPAQPNGGKSENDQKDPLGAADSNGGADDLPF